MRFYLRLAKAAHNPNLVPEKRVDKDGRLVTRYVRPPEAPQARASDRKELRPGRYAVLGVNDDQAHCDACGRNDLKRVVAIVPLDADGNWDGPVSYVGTDCASRLTSAGGGTRDAKRIQNEALAERSRVKAELDERHGRLPQYERIVAIGRAALATSDDRVEASNAVDSALHAASPALHRLFLDNVQLLARSGQIANRRAVLEYLATRAADIRRRAELLGLKPPPAPGVDTLNKALPAHLVPKYVVRVDGRRQRYWVDPRTDRSAKPVPREDVHALAEMRRWERHPLARHLSPSDLPSARLLAKLGKDAVREFEPGDWRDPVGGGERHLSVITDKEQLAAIQKRLDDSAGHEGRNVKLINAYTLEYRHEGFDKSAAALKNVQRLYHGVNAGRAAAVIATGLKTPEAVGSVTGAMFGPGIYFAKNSTKSAQYITGRFTTGNARGVMLEADVVLGNSFETTTKQPQGIPDNDDPASSAHVDYRAVHDATNWEDLNDVLNTYQERVELAQALDQINDTGDAIYEVDDLHDNVIVPIFDLHDDDAIAESVREKLQAQELDDPVEAAAIKFLTSTDAGARLVKRAMVPNEYELADAALLRIEQNYSVYDPEDVASELLEAYEAGAFGEDLLGPDGEPLDGDELEQSFYNAIAGVDPISTVEEYLRAAWRDSERGKATQEAARKALAPPTAPERKFHSIHARAGDHLKFDEFVVYDPNQVRIRHVLEVEVITDAD